MKKQAKIFLLDLNHPRGLSNILREILESSSNFGIQLRHQSIEVVESGSCYSELYAIISDFNPDILFLVLSPVHFKKIHELFQSLGEKTSQIPIIIVIEGCNPGEMFELLKLGAADFITPPLKAVDIIPRVWRLLEQMHRSKTLTYTLKEKLGLQQLVGESSTFLVVIKKVPLAAKCDATVLISGETGTGKELCARAIHYLSPRAGKPFVPVTCGAIPTELMENELFGHIRGAFTGASSSQPGLIHEADGGTLFLDDIDCLPLPAQVKLLRLLQEKEYRQLGSTKTRQADVRIIAATNLALEESVGKGEFRQDLYYRLNIIPLKLPPLRERREDIPVLTHHFLRKYSTEFDKLVTDCTSEAMRALVLYEWPGNVRELEYVIQRAVLFSEKKVIHDVDIDLPHQNAAECQESFKEAKAKVIEHFERDYIQGLLLAYRGNISRAAQAAQKNRRAFWQLIRKHRIDVQSFRTG